MLQLLRTRDFRSVFAALLISNAGDWLALVAVFSLIAFDWKGNPTAMSGAVIAAATPFVLLGPLAGVYVDRWSVRTTMIAADLVRAGLVVTLALSPQGLWHVYLVLFTLSAASCFFAPAQTAAIPKIVRQEDLLGANALLVQCTQWTKILGPLVAGVVVASVGERLCFALDAVSFVVSAILLSRITAMPRVATPTGSGFRSELREGWRVLAKSARLRLVALALVLTVATVGAFDALVAVFVRDHLGAGQAVLGGLMSAAGIGTVVGALLLGRYLDKAEPLRLVALGMFTLGAGIACLALSRAWPEALAAAFVLGVAASAVTVPVQTVMQQDSPQGVLGRVSSTVSALVTVAQLGAVAIAGHLAGLWGIRRLYIGVSVPLALVALVGIVTTRHRTSPAVPEGWRRSHRPPKVQ